MSQKDKKAIVALIKLIFAMTLSFVFFYLIGHFFQQSNIYDGNERLDRNEIIPFIVQFASSLIISFYLVFKENKKDNLISDSEKIEKKTIKTEEIKTAQKKLDNMSNKIEEKVKEVNEVSEDQKKMKEIFNMGDKIEEKVKEVNEISEDQKRIKEIFKSDWDLLNEYGDRERFFQNTVDSSYNFRFSFLYSLDENRERIKGILICNEDDGKHITYTKDDIERFKLIDKNSNHEQSFVRTAAKGGLGYILLGPVGLLAGALSTKKKLREKVKFGIEFTDKNWIILEYEMGDGVDEEEIKIFTNTLFYDNNEGIRPAPF